MNIYVGTTSQLKLDALQKVLDQYAKAHPVLEGYKLFSKKVNHSFTETPYGKETYELARKRAVLLTKDFPSDNAFYIGIESGLIKRHGFSSKETWGAYTDMHISRQVSIAEACRNSLIYLLI